MRALRFRAPAYPGFDDDEEIQPVRIFGGMSRPRNIPPAANDNKIVRLVAHNGGCSTTSGLVPVSLPRVAEPGDTENEVMAAGRAVTEYALQQVAA